MSATSRVARYVLTMHGSMNTVKSYSTNMVEVVPELASSGTFISERIVTMYSPIRSRSVFFGISKSEVSSLCYTKSGRPVIMTVSG